MPKLKIQKSLDHVKNANNVSGWSLFTVQTFLRPK